VTLRAIIIVEALALLAFAFLARAEAAPVATVCAELAAETTHPEPDARAATCERLAWLAEASGVPTGLVLAVAYVETHYDPEPARMCGPLQVARSYHCRDCTHEECERAGVWLLTDLLDRYRGDVRRALLRYLRGGLPVEAQHERFVGAVLERARDIARQLAAVGGEA